MQKMRLDILLVERKLVVSRSIAQGLVMAGKVRVNGLVIDKPATNVAIDSAIELDAERRFVSRGGEKLEAALVAFNIGLEGQICADVGCSTGGFTDCMLKHGAVRVYAIDVGKGILTWKLRQDERVVVMEEINARYLEKLPEPVNFIGIDVSFISLKLILPVVKGWLYTPFPPNSSVLSIEGVVQNKSGSTGEVIALIKPQFEAGKAEAARGEGVIRDPAIHRAVLREVLSFAIDAGYGAHGLIRSPLVGPKGNTEFLVWLRDQSNLTVTPEKLIGSVLGE